MADKQPTVICCQRKDSNKNSSVFSDSDPYVSDEGSDYVPDTNTSESSDMEVNVRKFVKKVFLSIHGLQNSRGRIKDIASKISSGCNTSIVDGRGHHGHHKRKYNEDQLRSVRSFIKELSKYQSHYSRSDNPN
ncbi:hypothetical protein ILUMI_15916, partial [Ignelater luminosus]